VRRPDRRHRLTRSLPEGEIRDVGPTKRRVQWPTNCRATALPATVLTTQQE
jgi:hypothetical protein